MSALFRIRPEKVVCDLQPLYFTTRFARVAVTLYQGGSDAIKILDPASLSWDSPVEEFQSDFLSNIRKMVPLGGYLYGISYGNNPYQGLSADVAQVWRFNMAENYAPDDTSFDYNPQPKQGHGEGLVAYGGHLYAILTAVTGSYPNFATQIGRASCRERV